MRHTPKFVASVAKRILDCVGAQQTAMKRVVKRRPKPYSATSQFFFNVTDNIFLDTADEGFTVFGEVTAGLNVIDAINDLQIINNGGAFSELPVLDSFVAGAENEADLIIVNSATVTSVPEPSSMIVISGLSMIMLQRRRRTQKPKSTSSN